MVQHQFLEVNVLELSRPKASKPVKDIVRYRQGFLLVYCRSRFLCCCAQIFLPHLPTISLHWCGSEREVKRSSEVICYGLDGWFNSPFPVMGSGEEEEMSCLAR